MCRRNGRLFFPPAGALLLAGFGACAPLETLSPHPGPDRSIELVPFTDMNPDPDIVEVALIACPAIIEYLPGKPAHVWAYRDGAADDSRPSVPGPLLEAKRGDEVIIHFRNDLEQDGTTVHHHGLRLPVEMDGAHQVLLPGETFDYRFTAKDAGTFWYHPHVSADVQIERGLYGPVHIREDAAPRSPAERILVLDDVKLAGNGDLAGEWSELDIALGRQGNRVLVNGAVTPKLQVISGSRERWHLVNAANGRFFQLYLAGHVFDVIGWDGGLVEVPYEAQTLLIAPGERYDVLVRIVDPPGKVLEVQTLPYDRGKAHPGPTSAETVFHVEATAGTPVDASPAYPGAVHPLPVSGMTKVRPFVLTEDIHGKYGPEFLINGEFWPFQTPIEATLGDTEIWEIHNDAEGDHPFHLHGMFFQVLSRNGVQEGRLGRKDTVLVPRKSALRFAVRYEQPGMWMYHCQIPEHAERGMMGEVLVSLP